MFRDKLSLEGIEKETKTLLQAEADLEAGRKLAISPEEYERLKKKYFDHPAFPDTKAMPEGGIHYKLNRS
jgi:hypothetical protein